MLECISHASDPSLIAQVCTPALWALMSKGLFSRADSLECANAGIGVSVVHFQGLSDNAVLSVKWGDERKQVPLKHRSRVCFANAKVGTTQPLRVDVLERVASFSSDSQPVVDDVFALEVHITQ